MPSTFPGTTDSFTSKADGVDDVRAAHINDLQNAVVAIENNIGHTAKGNQADLSARLDVSINPDGTLKSTAVTPGANTVGASQILDGSVGTNELANGAVTNPKLGADAVTADKIQDGAVGTNELAAGAVTSTKLGDNSVQEAKIVDQAVTAAKLHARLRNHVEHLMDVAAKGTATVYPLTATDTAVHNSGITNPEVPRNVSFTLKNISAGALTNNAGWAAIVGVDAQGQAVSENITIPSQSVNAGDSVTAEGSKAFARVDSIQLSDGQTADWQFSIGTGDKVGVANTLAVLYKLKKNAADVAPLPAADAANGTVNLATIGAGDDFTLWYRSA